MRLLKDTSNAFAESYTKMLRYINSLTFPPKSPDYVTNISRTFLPCRVFEYDKAKFSYVRFNNPFTIAHY